jgi:tetratricopeptide (TPR) repeat protein
MANEELIDPRKKFVPRWLPWLLAAAAFLIYWLTLNHWISLFNGLVVAKISGWTWQPEIYSPLFFTVTYPFRWLPKAQIPAALDLFSAACAAMTLGLLARSVAILPHDRTEAQRRREGNDLSFLTIWSAWLPPVFAVAVCGLQMTFWEQATNCTGAMFDLLLFAFVIWSLLEYRLDKKLWRLFLAALVYGAGMTDDWALIGFLPLFVAALIWIRGLSFFNLRFLAVMLLCGLAGMLFYFLLPVLDVASHKIPITFWEALRANLSAQWRVIKLFFTREDIRYTLALLSLASLLPVFVLAIRWRTGFGDNSKIGVLLANFMFHLVHAVILFVCVWVAFDPPFSPRHLGYGLPFLNFYFLGALSVGYYSGYLLLVFRKKNSSRSRRKKPSPFESFDRLAVGGVWLFAAVAIIGLAYKNGPQIRAANDDTFKTYATLTEENLPRDGGILLSDDAQRMFLTEAAMVRDGRAKNFVFVDTQSLPAPAYHRYLHEKFPKQWPDTISAAEKTNGISPLHLIALLATLAKTNELYYLHPSFGYYFEQFCLEPRGLVCKLNTLPNDTLLPPLPDKIQIAANEDFWARAEQTAFVPVLQALAPPDPTVPQSYGEKLLALFQVGREPNPNAAVAGTFYSRSLDFWAVQVQRDGDLTNAAAHFDLAQKLNPDNVVAQINLQFNESLIAGKIPPVDLSTTTPDRFGKSRSWNEVLDADGPFDEPSFCMREGLILMRGGLIRQAVEPFNRVHQLLPDDLNSRYYLAQIYIASRLPNRALDVLREPLDAPEKFSLTATNSTDLNLLAATAHLEKNETTHGVQLIDTEISRHPADNNLLMAAAQIYVARGLFTNALTVIDRQLQLTPDDPTWLFGKGYASIQVKKYGDAVAALTRVLDLQTNNVNALFNRAVAYLNDGKLDAARADYETLRASYTNSFQVAYGLGEIAWRQHDTNAAIQNYEAYLTTARTNTVEARNIIQRLRELKGQPN